MKIIYDSREKLYKIEPILKRFEEWGIETERKKLETGDYYNEDNPRIIVDRKGGGLWEMAVDLGHDFDRFKAEIKRARQADVILVVLIADDNRICLEDVESWNPPYDTHGKTKAMSGPKLYKIMKTLAAYYRDCLHFEFVKSDEMADRIIELLS